MKKILFALALLGLLLPMTPRVEAATEVSVNFFYDNLSPYGSWIEVGDYGYCFQPNAAVDNADWRPYSDGYWAYTDLGWTWVSYEDFGWATYHYGRWTNLESYGWVWVPGYEWGPAWVSWRTGGDYIGWAPLPPAGPQVYEGRAITGQVDIAFDIGPLYYNFVDIRYIGAPVLRERIIASRDNITIINRTVNVTNITYNNSVVYNYGPDFNRVNEFATQPVKRFTIKRDLNVQDFQNKRGNFNRVNGEQLVVAAPAVQKSAQKSAPRQVKARVEKPELEHGWRGVQNRDQLQAQMKKENAKDVPPPTFKPQPGKGQAAEPNAGAQPNRPNESKQARQGGAEERQAARQQSQQEQSQQNQEDAPADRQSRGDEERKARRAERLQGQGVQGSNENERPAAAARPDPRGQSQLERMRARQQARRAQAVDAQENQGQGQPQAGQEERKANRIERRPEQPNDQQNGRPERAAQPQQDDSQRAERAQQRRERAQEQQQQQERPQPQTNESQNVRREQRQEARQNRRPQPQQADQGPQSQDQGDQARKRKGKKSQPDAQPTP